MTAIRSWPPVVVLAGAVPLLPWASVLMQRDGVLATTVFPVLFFLWAMMGVGSVVIARHDPWLGALCGWWTVSLLWTRNGQALETTGLLVLGGLAIVAVQRLTAADRQMVMRLAFLAVALQVGTGLLQAAGVEWIWPVKWGVIGSIGNPGYLALLVAAFTPLALGLAIPLCVGVLLVAKSNLAVLAACAGLGLRYRRFWPYWMLAGLVGVGLIFLTRDPQVIWNGLTYRLDIWRLALTHLSGWEWVMGKGPGQWLTFVPHWQDVDRVYPGYYFTYAHSEWVQVLFEGGFLSMAFIGLWFWTHRGAFTGRYAGALWAVLILSSGWFVFHLANVGVPVLMLIGAATADQEASWHGMS